MAKNFRITFHIEGDEAVHAEALPGETLLRTARRVGVPIDAPCAGNGTCGKCKVWVESGSVQSERTKHLSTEEYARGGRLACMSNIIADAVIRVPPSALAYRNRIIVNDFAEDVEPLSMQTVIAALAGYGLGTGSAPEIGAVLNAVQVSLNAPNSGDQTADKERLIAALLKAPALHGKKIRLALTALRKLPELLRETDFALSCVLRCDDDDVLVLDVRDVSRHVEYEDALDTKPAILGVAIDIGTTSVSALLVDLTSGKPLATGSAGNAQIRYGADVIGRLIESARPGGLNGLRSALTDECIAPLIRQLCVKAGSDPTSVYRVSIAANTTMAHLFAGVYANHLRMEPYIPAFFELGTLTGLEAEIGIHPDAEVVIAPAIGSYVGGDITAGVFASGMNTREQISLLVDLGTNGEIVLGNSDFLMACACSAGPAFEGGEISCGVRATDGAIEACTIDEKTLNPAFRVIGGEKPVGICGSGLIDIVGELFRCGAINAKGKFVKEAPRIRTDEWGISGYTVAGPAETADGKAIEINDADIDNFIRAKGSIFSAIRTMLNMLGFDASVIEKVYIAGGIGGGIDIGRTILIGMLPDIGIEKYEYIGNSSLSGAYAMLVSPGVAARIDEIGRGMTYVELSAQPGYMDEFIAACFLPHTDGTLFGNRK
ncbi:MAG: ASKHA domain-containing protein [Clostridiales Family XIII bacterium]|jgi:uncharacterized 2Fe-2S/4Fe-4S cluster protein (DUF4445 family)|nr:ASKHA domain-containing protein [Clostridiales Family XIII bacterium]